MGERASDRVIENMHMSDRLREWVSERAGERASERADERAREYAHERAGERASEWVGAYVIAFFRKRIGAVQSDPPALAVDRDCFCGIYTKYIT